MVRATYQACQRVPPKPPAKRSDLGEVPVRQVRRAERVKHRVPGLVREEDLQWKKHGERV